MKNTQFLNGVIMIKVLMLLIKSGVVIVIPPLAADLLVNIREI